MEHILAIKRERIADLLTGAFEGGSNYWYFIDHIEKPPVSYAFWGLGDLAMTEGGHLMIEDKAEGKGNTYRLDLDAVERGLKVFLTRYRKHFDDFINGIDDSVTSDIFLQCCLFGEVIYG